MNQKYRHENKYYCTITQQRILQEKLKGVMQLDPHVNQKGYYEIRSIYFDDYANSCFYDNENGTEPRMKYRIRTYLDYPEYIKLECKHKRAGMTLKDSCNLTKEQADFLIAGRVPRLEENAPKLLKKFCADMMRNILRAKVLVVYDRYPYIYREGNVRITFDANLRSSNRMDLFWDKQIPSIPIYPSGRLLLEVKYDEFLPEFILELLQISALRQTTFSKFYLCRNNTMGIGVKKNEF